jgi:hypothetical protein
MLRSRALLAWGWLAVAAGPAAAGEAAVIVPEVEVRSGPSPAFYATGKLFKGDVVEVRKEVNGGAFLEIAPPVGSFSLVRKEAVKPLSPTTGVVTVENEETLIGSKLSDERKQRGARLSKGYQVTIMDEVTVTTPQGPVAYYKIVPVNESRYLPAEAIRQPEPPGGVPASPSAPGSPPPSGAPGTSGQPAAPVGDVRTRIRLADQAYQRGDLVEAKRLYEDLARSLDPGTRQLALSRLDLIAKRSGSAGRPADGSGWRASPAPSTPVGSGGLGPINPVRGSPPRANSSYTYAEDRTPSRLQPTPGGAPPAGPPASPPAASGPATTTAARPDPGKGFGPKPPVSPPEYGYLRRTTRSEQGRPLYFLENSQGRPVFYFTPLAGQNVEPFVDRQVELRAAPKQYRRDLSGFYAPWAEVRPYTP